MRVPRTFVFVDISGFTNFTTENGDDAAGRLLASWRAVTRDVASETGVRIAKWLGDGCMIVAVDQRDAVTFALELQKRSLAACAPLSIRVGIASGLALLFEGDDYIGTAVNLAARLCDAAEPFEVIIPSDQIEILPEGVIAEPHTPLSLRGMNEAIHVVTLSGEAANAARNDTGELWTRSPFVI
jgi:adenylate cyclase